LREIRLKSPAKINWRLHVGSLRADGFHSLDTVYQTLEFSDEMLVRSRVDDECHLSGFPADISPDKNLVYQAWLKSRAEFPSQVSGVDVRCEKVLPRGGGLGGGSSNAGAMIKALSTLFSLGDAANPAHLARLHELAASIGSDVPFFISGGTARGTGRGEIIHQLPAAPVYWLVLIMPEEGVSTAEAYRILDETPRAAHDMSVDPAGMADFARVLASGDPHLLGPHIANDFELVAARYDWFKAATGQLKQSGALRAFLCGSGSTVAGLCADRQAAVDVAAKIPGSIVTHTIA
jgi:4-diphosphocytidyl-2-C-methyl-D-erythritol kinase